MHYFKKFVARFEKGIFTFEGMSTPKISANFEKEYNQLNEAQREAVNQIEGEVLVIAGPGTGKTQILAARIANILLKTDAAPENILCLTYTDSGAIAMRKRLIKFIGPDAYRVGIHTFHSFCNFIIQSNLDLFGLRNLDAVSELEQIQIVHEIIDTFPSNHPLKRYTGEVYYETKRLLNLFEVMKKEGWQAEHITSKIDVYLKEIPLRDEYIYKKDSKYGKKGEVKQKEYQAEVKRMEQLKSAVLTFDIYQEKLKKASRFDFADMILWVNKAFVQTPELLLQYQEQFQYFLVDEFQDTSGSQNELLQLLINYWEQPNVFVVGDDDQSIYRFQGANVENIRNFTTKFSDSLKVVMLTDNYRSSAVILSASKSLIDKNTERISNNKTLVASNPEYATITEKPEVRAYFNIIHETVGIALEIEQLNKSGVALNEIAVIYKNHVQSETLIRYLQSKNIAVNTRRRINVLQEILVKKIITILRYVHAENFRPNSGENFLFEMIHFNEFNIDALVVAKMSVEIYRKNFNEKNTSWRNELNQFLGKTQTSLFNENNGAKQIQAFSKIVEGLIRDFANCTLQELIEKIISKTGILFNALTANNKTWNLELLNTFFDFVKNETSKNSKLKLSQLIELIDLMEDNGIQLPAEKISYSENGVNFITAHSSKGLEFEYVYMISCTKDKWDSSRSYNNFKLPDNLFAIAGDEMEEARRLFYVSMTRAKKKLVVSFPEHDLNRKELEKSRFVSELEDAQENVHSSTIQLSDDKLVDFNLQILNPQEAIIPPNLFEGHFIDSILDKYSLSVTHLNNYLKCPVTFYFNNLIRVPAPKSASMTFGSAVHYALEKLFKNMNAHPEKLFGTTEDLINDFKWYMRKNEDSFTPKEFKLRIEYAENFLPLYYVKYLNEWNKVTSVERSYRNVVIDGVPINGKLDKLEFNGNLVNVVDYKTGQFKNAENKFSQPDMVKYQKAIDENKAPKFEHEFGGDYWRQAVFYRILMDNDKTRNWEMRSAEFDFVEPDKESKEFIRRKVEMNDSDIEIVRNQITSVYSKILNREFNKGCGKPECEWCNFVKDVYSGNKSDDLKFPTPIEND